jgi:hypothetical protein
VGASVPRAAARLGDTLPRRLSRYLLGSSIVFLTVAADCVEEMAMGHESSQGTAAGFCGSSDPTALATSVTEELAAYYQHAGAMVFVALAAGLSFLCWHALQRALFTVTKGGRADKAGRN